MRVNRRQFIKTVAASTLLLSNTNFINPSPIFSTCDTGTGDGYFSGLTMQNKSPKAPLVSVYGLGHQGTRSVKYLSVRADIPDVAVKTGIQAIEEGHLNFLIMGYYDWMTAYLEKIQRHCQNISNLKIAVLGVSVADQGITLRNDKFRKLAQLTNIFDTVLLVPDLRKASASIPFGPNHNHSEFFKYDEFLADTVLEVAFKMLDGGYLGPDLVDLERCFRQNGIGFVGTGVASGTNRGERAAALAELSLNTLLNDSMKTCKGVYVISSSFEKHPFGDIDMAIEFTMSELGKNAEYIFGYCYRKIPSSKHNPFRITLIATGMN